MRKILANDGIDAGGKKILEAAGFEVQTEKVPQEELAHYIQANQIEALTVRSATQVRKELLDACPHLKVIGRGGVGMDNIDVDYARSIGKKVVNTPAASSNSVAELVMASLFCIVRNLHDSNRKMPLEGENQFEALKKKYSKGSELAGKTIGIVGFGRIGQSVACKALGVGMRVVAYDPFVQHANLTLDIHGAGKVSVLIKTEPLADLLKQSDAITVHVPGGQLLGKDEIAHMKKGVLLVNTSRGGVINETDLLAALDSGSIAQAALDVFEHEPNPNPALLKHPNISLTPHIGAATEEAQARIGIELASLLVASLNA
jgi:D-3-phosphoglycerate dehydrogenase